MASAIKWKCLTWALAWFINWERLNLTCGKIYKVEKTETQRRNCTYLERECLVGLAKAIYEKYWHGSIS